MSEDERLAYNLQREEFNRYNNHPSSSLIERELELETNDN